MNDENDISLKEIMSQLFLDYYDLYPGMPTIPINIVFTDCLSKSHLELRPDMKDRLLKEGIEKEDDGNGRMVPPHNVGEYINILLNRKRLMEYIDDESSTWRGTFAHELTHAIDYFQMAVKENLNIYDPLSETDGYLMFQLWSEYHARKLGYSFLRNQLHIDSDDGNEKERVKHILEVELPFHTKAHYKEYHETNDGIRQMYITMQLLGRCSVWCDLFPETFNESALKSIYINTPWIYDIFVFLRQHDTLDRIYSDFESMRLVLKKNWRGL